MKIRLIFAIPVIIASIAACGGKQRPKPTKITFETDFDQAKARATETNEPMIIDFYTSWCKWCDSLDANTYTDPLVVGMSVDDIFVKINAEEDTALAKKYGVTAYPTIVLTKPDGQEIDRIWGYLPPTDFYNQIQLYLQGKETLEDYLARLKDEPDNLEYLSMIGEKYASRGRFAEALSYYKRILPLDPSNEKGYRLRTMQSIYDAQGRAGDFDSAIATCESIIGAFPDSKEADEASAMIAYYTEQKGDTQKALKIYRDYLSAKPGGANADWAKKRVADLEDKQ